MKALVVNKKGNFETQEWELGPVSHGQVRVKMQYAGVGFADMMAVRGGYMLAPKRPFSPGYEFMGTIEDTGQRVVGITPKMTCYREFIDIDPVWAVPVPASLAAETAAALPLNILTARGLIEYLADLQPGQSFLIHGAAGGVGSVALEWARLKGIRAFGTVSAGKEADIEALGAIPIRRGEGWTDQAQRLEPRGFDAVFDAFAGRLLPESYSVLAPGGILVSYGFSPTLDGGNGPLIKGLMFHGSRKLFPQGRRTAIFPAPATAEKDPAWYRSTLETTLTEAAAGNLHPKIHDIVPWDQMHRAHEAIASGQVRGKILLKF